MLWTAVGLLLLMWVVGVATSNTFLGYINVLYIVAFVLAIVRLVMKRRVV